jgi:tripartite-type tricarboxylate transporter receptor subunit TctC
MDIGMHNGLIGAPAAGNKLTRRAVTGGLLAAPLLASRAQAQRAFPERPVRLVVPYGPGTGTEVFARQVVANMQAILGQPVVVENRAGASGIPGTEVAARAPADGYTLLFANDQIMCLNPALFQRLPFNLTRDFVPVAGLATMEYVLVVTPGLAARSVAELVALAKARPGHLNFAATGIGTASHLIGAVFARDAGIEMTFVPYSTGATQLFADLFTGTVQLMFYPWQFVKPHVESGRLRALATAGRQRAEWLPDLPTLSELGYANSVTATWFAVYAPTGTPEDRIARLSDAFRQAVQLAEFRSTLAALGTSLNYLPPPELATFTTAEMDRCRASVAISGAKVE